MLQQMDYVILDSKSFPIFSLPLSQTERIVNYITSMIYITLNFFIVLFSGFKFALKKNLQKKWAGGALDQRTKQKERLFWFRPNADA